jgi:outer membrane receptor protein involved in Fe transport
VAEEGDFSAAGAAHISSFNVLDRPLLKLEGGEDRYGRIVAAGSPRLGGGHLLYAGEVLHHDGPWVNPDGFRKLNGVLRYSRGGQQDGFSLTASGYDARWTSTDQVAQRAVDDGTISRFGTLDPSDGGRTRRLALSGEWRRSGASGRTEVEAFGIDYRLNLFSNFTYFLDDPENGDQYEQEDRRTVAGLKASHRWLGRWGTREVENVAGVQVRNDDIPTVGLYHTRDRVRLGVFRKDAVTQRSGSAFAQNATQWTSWLRTIAGVRADYYRFDVDSDNPANSGADDASLVSPKLTAVLGPWSHTEVYLNAGYGFHSNDVRGRTSTVDPKTNEPSASTNPLVRAKGAEIGLRTTALRNVHSTVTVWGLDIASELIFVGDAGATEASRPTRRVGVEWANYVNLKPWLTLDADFAYSHARFRDDDVAGDRVPGATEGVASVGLTVEDVKHVSGSLRLRYFGPRPLIEDNRVRSVASTTFNARVRYAITRRYGLSFDVFNIFDAAATDVDYFYASRLPGEAPDGVDDVHTHPLEPRAFRASLTVAF